MNIGIQALKELVSELLRNIRDKRTRQIITRPVNPASAKDPVAWDNLHDLGEKISQSWTSDRSAADILSGMRR